MQYLWRKLTNRCTRCGQKLNSRQSLTQRTSEINERVSDLVESLGRPPQVQNCSKCDRIVFETEPGFVYRGLLIDFMLDPPFAIQRRYDSAEEKTPGFSGR